MSRFRLSFLLTLALLFSARPILATNFAVGNCKPSLPSFPNISAAVSSPLTVGSTVMVCPGTYAEQVTIAQSLTLQGITSGNSAQPVITVPASGLTANITDPFGSPFAAQVGVNAGPVNISNITVDGTGGSNGCSLNLVGIFYENSSGTVNEVTVRNEMNAGCGFGIFAENATATNESVTIENSSVHDVDGSALLAASNQTPPTLTATIKGNYVESSYIGVFEYTGAGPGSVTGNTITAGQISIISVAPSVTISSNTLINSPIGISADATGISATSNKIWNSSSPGFFGTARGIDFGASGMTIQSNFIAKSAIGIEFNCNTGNTVSHNTINDAAIGLDSVPLILTTPPEFLFNVATIRTDGCGFALSRPVSVPSPANRHTD
jgi:hypothetical protein